MTDEIKYTAEYGTGRAAEMLGITKTELLQNLRDSEVERRPQDSWMTTCKRHLKKLRLARRDI